MTEEKKLRPSTAAAVNTAGALLVLLGLFVGVPLLFIGLMALWNVAGLPGFIGLILVLPVVVTFFASYAHARGTRAKKSSRQFRKGSTATRAARRATIRRTF
jgi:membrane protein implicated in regulation of membrane protease activity